MEPQKAPDTQNNAEQKAMLEMEPPPVLKYITEPQQLKPYGTGTKADIQINGGKLKTPT